MPADKMPQVPTQPSV